ncbi:hypothetical protein EDB89DRAFT_1912496 [Lactarius sanguifluus]|nr:hypothetical protein EDB89DRAFT_1912496 [Lactarius sanguifluus]
MDFDRVVDEDDGQGAGMGPEKKKISRREQGATGVMERHILRNGNGTRRGTARLAGLLNGGGTSCGMGIALHAEHGKGAALLAEGEFVGFRGEASLACSGFVEGGTASSAGRVEASLACPGDTKWKWGEYIFSSSVKLGSGNCNRSSVARWNTGKTASLAVGTRGDLHFLAVRIHIFSGMRRPFAGVLQIVVNLAKPILLGNPQLAFNLPFDSARWKGAKYSQYFGLSLKPGNQWCFLLIREFVGKW